MNKYIPPKQIERQQHNWSKYQLAIIDNIKNGSGHTIIEALAGCAKTSTIIESLYHVPKNKKTIVLAFNKSIQVVLKSRCPANIEAITFHALGMRAIKQKFGAVELDDNKVYTIINNLHDFEHDMVSSLYDTVAFCKYGIVGTPAGIEEVIMRFGIDLCDMDMDSFVKLVMDILAIDKEQTSVIDYNDMCWFPHVHNLFLGKYDLIFVDEAHDLNLSQMSMAKKLCNTNGRIIPVLDMQQNIYSWRFSDVSIILDMKKDPTTKVLSLPITYRCPKAIVELAKNWVPEFTACENAEEGNIEEISVNELLKLAKPGCFILSRTNAPLIDLCLTFIRNGQKANIRGRDIGKQLLSLIKKSKKKQIASFIEWLKVWKDSEVKRLTKIKSNTDSVLDRYECLVALCQENKTLEQVKTKIDELFNDVDQKNIITLSSVHRAKGDERENVFVLRWTFSTWLDKAWMTDKPNEPMNIAYVAISRSKKNLFIVNSWK